MTSRYTGTYDWETGRSGCTAEPQEPNCMSEDDLDCHECGTPIRQHYDEDGTPRLTQRLAELVPA